MPGNPGGAPDQQQLMNWAPSIRLEDGMEKT
jgi:hypothetical protein